MISAEFDGNPIENSMVKWVSGTLHGGVTTVSAGPQTILKANYTCSPPRQIVY